MGEQHIQIRQLFNAPVDTLFDILTDHESFGQVINANIKRVVDSPGENRNGIGSVRRISVLRKGYALALVDVRVLDHFIVTAEDSVSFADTLLSKPSSRSTPVIHHSSSGMFAIAR